MVPFILFSKIVSIRFHFLGRGVRSCVVITINSQHPVSDVSGGCENLRSQLGARLLASETVQATVAAAAAIPSLRAAYV